MEPSHSCWIVDTGVWTQPQPRGDSSIEGAAMQSWPGLSTRRTGLGVLEGEHLWHLWQVLAGSGRFWQVLAGSGIWASGTGRVLASGHLGIWCLASGRVLASGHLGCEL